jgi:MFS family permease
MAQPNLERAEQTPESDSHSVDQANRAIWDRDHLSLTLGLLVTVSVAAFESLAVATALPAAVREIGGLDLYGWAFSAFMLTNLIGISTAGHEADLRGPARPFLLGILLFTSGLAIAGFAPSMRVVALARLVQGLGAGALSSIAYVAVARGYPSPAKPRMLALLSSAWVLPGLIGPAIAATVADHVGWRWVFFGLVPPTVIAGALTVASLGQLGAATPGPDVKRDDDPPPRGLAALGLAVGTGAALAGIDARSPLVAVSLLLPGVALAGAMLRRLVPAGTLRARPGLPAAIATAGLLGLSFFGAEAFVALSYTEVRGESVSAAGVALTVGTLAWTAGAWIQARAAGRGQRRFLVILGLCLMAAGIAGTAGALVPGWTAVPLASTSRADARLVDALVAGSWSLVGLGMGLAYSTVSLIVLEAAPAAREGESSAAMQLANVLGIAVGTGLGGACLALVTGAGGSVRSGIALVDAITAAGALLAIFCATRLPAGRRASAPAGPTKPSST